MFISALSLGVPVPREPLTARTIPSHWALSDSLAVPITVGRSRSSCIVHSSDSRHIGSSVLSGTHGSRCSRSDKRSGILTCSSSLTPAVPTVLDTIFGCSVSSTELRTTLCSRGWFGRGGFRGGGLGTRLFFFVDACCCGARDFLGRISGCSDAFLFFVRTDESSRTVEQLDDWTVAAGESWNDFFILDGQGGHMYALSLTVTLSSDWRHETFSYRVSSREGPTRRVTIGM